ncbi:MAG TPA: M1 family metallopeptidase [Gammaproteobacteria bacterium]|nr:M1 family metallopeptidase [Gammaproteobacteria bacterium]
MQKLLLSTLVALGAVAFMNAAVAAPASSGSNYDPLQTFAPFNYPQPVNQYRSANGTPGPAYWQNRVDYKIHATLDPANKALSGRETITYTNHSPDTLHLLWLQLDQNRYRTDARANFTHDADHEPPQSAHTDGYRIKSVEAATDGHFEPVHFIVSDTRMRIDLPQPLAPKHGRVQVRIVYSYTIPGKFGGRTDWYHTKNGDVFEIAQWYPRLCVYDDLRGWNTLPFTNNEFYLEYGNIDYSVTVPWNMIVVGSGKLMNPDEVLTKVERERLEKARHSDKTVLIRTPAEVNDPASRPTHSGTLTWHFHMNNTRDVAFGASTAYVWDAARINLPSGKHALAMSAYPVESLKDGGWDRSTQFVKATVEFFSKYTGVEFPWPTEIAEAGIAGGMEYPGIVFDWWKTGGKGLFGLTTHEVGHAWFPMIVGSNERRDAWMDEGFNTFVDVLAAHAYNHGEFAPKRDSEYAPGGGNPVDEIQSVLKDPDAPPIMMFPDVLKEKYRHPVTYFKTALGLMLLRDQILGPERFDTAFRQYARAWAFKHPSPSDFFRAMSSAGGEELSWFWRGWFAHNWQLDMAVEGVKYVDNDPAKGALVTVANLDKLVMPATLQVTYVDGSTRRVRVPVETWQRHHKFEVTVPGDKRVKSATIDPDHAIPDGNRSNDTFTVK